MIGRPNRSEAAASYFTYIDQAEGNDPLRLLEEQLREAESFFSGISEEKSLHRYAPEKWSIRQGLNHVSDTERSFAFRALWFARAFTSPLPGYDPDIAAESANADQVSWAAHVEEFRRVRLATISLFQNLPQTGWMRSGIASDNSFTVRALAFIIAGHFAHHVTLVRERYLKVS